MVHGYNPNFTFDWLTFVQYASPLEAKPSPKRTLMLCSTWPAATLLRWHWLEHGWRDDYRCTWLSIQCSWSLLTKLINRLEFCGPALPYAMDWQSQDHSQFPGPKFKKDLRLILYLRRRMAGVSLRRPHAVSVPDGRYRLYRRHGRDKACKWAISRTSFDVKLMYVACLSRFVREESAA